MTRISLFLATLATLAVPSMTLNGGTLWLNIVDPTWKAFEVITFGNDPDDGVTYAIPGTFDGVGAYLMDGGATLRIQVNHELRSSSSSPPGASISQVDVDVAALQTAIVNVQNTNQVGVPFVKSADRAYGRYSLDGGATWVTNTDPSISKFYRFCSGQSFGPNTFGNNRGFVDEIYITGEEGGSTSTSGRRLFALDSVNRDFYALSGSTGGPSAGPGNPGMPKDAWENAALIDTHETNHVALLLSPDAGSTAKLQLYVGVKGKDQFGNKADSFLARNGLAYGSWYYLVSNQGFPAAVGGTVTGTLGKDATGSALSASKLEDIDTSPDDPRNLVILANQDYGVFLVDICLFFSNQFDPTKSSFSVTKVTTQDAPNNEDVNVLANQDNIEWTRATDTHPEGLIFINEDNDTGEIWRMNPDGSEQILIANTKEETESSGILDISSLLGYRPASIIVTVNQGNSHTTPSSMTILISPEAEIGDAGNLPSVLKGLNGEQNKACYTFNNGNGGGNNGGVRGRE